MNNRRRRALFAGVLVGPLIVAGAGVWLAFTGAAAAEADQKANAWNEEHAPTPAEFCEISAMIGHHQQAIELSDILRTNVTDNTDLRAYAEFIAQSQTTEISQMTQWLTAWSTAVHTDGPPAGRVDHDHKMPSADAPDAVADHCEMTGMTGMATPDQILAFRSSTGVEASTQYVEMMIAHHQGAITMARHTLTDATNPFVLSSARHTVGEQSAEIAQLQGLRTRAQSASATPFK